MGHRLCSTPFQPSARMSWGRAACSAAPAPPRHRALTIPGGYRRRTVRVGHWAHAGEHSALQRRALLGHRASLAEVRQVAATCALPFVDATFDLVVSSLAIWNLRKVADAAGPSPKAFVFSRPAGAM